MNQLYLFRHGEPEADYPQRFLGHTNPGLSPHGREQAAMIRSSYPELADLPVWTSPLLRALQTCEIAFPHANLCIEPLAMECHFGVLESLRPEAALRLYPEAIECFVRNPLSFVPNGGEGWCHLQARARKLSALLTDRTNVLISHQYIAIALVSELTREPLPHLLTLPFDYGQCWMVENDDATGRWVLREATL